MLNANFKPVYGRYVIEGKTIEIESEKGCVKVSVKGTIVLLAPFDDVKSSEVDYATTVAAIYGRTATSREWNLVISEVRKFAHSKRARV